jgi:hypothetical protein
VEAGRIKEWLADWDTDNWKESLRRYQKLGEGNDPKKERRRFRNACFWELHQVFSQAYSSLMTQYVGCLFFKDYPTKEEEEEACPQH